MKDPRSRLSRVASLASALVNVLVFDGSPDESISGRAYRQGVLGGNRAWRRAAARINCLFRDPFHCRDAHELDLAFARAVLGIEKEPPCPRSWP